MSKSLLTRNRFSMPEMLSKKIKVDGTTISSDPRMQSSKLESMNINLASIYNDKNEKKMTLEIDDVEASSQVSSETG